MCKVNSNYRCNSIRGALCALLIGAIGPVSGQWEQVQSGTTSFLKDIFFLNDSMGYCVGGGDMYGYPNAEQAVVLRSLDGGSTWGTALQDTGVAFTELAAKGDTVVCFGRSMAIPSLLWTSFDKGTTWQRDTLGVQGIQDLSFFTDDLLFLSGQDLVRMNLSTLTAQTLFIPNTASVYGRDGNRLYLMTTQKSIHSSADGGQTWDTIPCFMADSLGMWTESDGEALFASGDTIAVKLTYNAVSAYTTDHGLHWTPYFSPFAAQVQFNSLDTMYGYHVAATTGGISISTDRGLTAQLQQQLGNRIGKLSFLPGTGRGWACGENGMISKTTNGGFATVVPDRMAPPAQITVQPNPAHNRLTLVVPSGMHVESIELLDSTQKRVRHYHASTRELNTQGLATGQYILQVGTGLGSQIIKVQLQ